MFSRKTIERFVQKDKYGCFLWISFPSIEIEGERYELEIQIGIFSPDFADNPEKRYFNIGFKPNIEEKPDQILLELKGEEVTLYKDGKGYYYEKKEKAERQKKGQFFSAMCGDDDPHPSSIGRIFKTD